MVALVSLGELPPAVAAEPQSNTAPRRADDQFRPDFIMTWPPPDRLPLSPHQSISPEHPIPRSDSQP